MMIMSIPIQMEWIGVRMIQKNVMNIMIERDGRKIIHSHQPHHHHNPVVVVGRIIEIEETITTMRKSNIIFEMEMNIQIIVEGEMIMIGMIVCIVTEVDIWVLCMMTVDTAVRTVVAVGMIAIDQVDHLEITTIIMMMMMGMLMMIIPRMWIHTGSRMIMTRIAEEEMMVTMTAITRNVLPMTQVGTPKGNQGAVELVMVGMTRHLIMMSLMWIVSMGKVVIIRMEGDEMMTTTMGHLLLKTWSIAFVASNL
mmetsp:Transcript_18648/g.26550  ORF Transcript_18648/g.26550 Transcript_18648/m.26550 type:complete len:252 (+) Transcript_18648:1080-1835(+)